jgi:hypothetical protein
MFTLSFDRTHKVLLARFTGIFTSEDMASLDAALIHFFSHEDQAHRKQVRGLYDLSAVEAVAVPASKVAERARQPPIVPGLRVVVAPCNAAGDFGDVYRRHQRIAADTEPMVVPTLEDAYALLGLADPRFEPLENAR